MNVEKNVEFIEKYKSSLLSDNLLLNFEAFFLHDQDNINFTKLVNRIDPDIIEPKFYQISQYDCSTGEIDSIFFEHSNTSSTVSQEKERKFKILESKPFKDAENYNFKTFNFQYSNNIFGYKSITKDIISKASLDIEKFSQKKTATAIPASVKYNKKVYPRSEKKVYAILEDITHDVPLFNQLVPQPAMTWPFELDNFQKQSILCIEKNQSVFVSAHTSAGKTLVAEYACALCRKRGSRAIFTSPIKALSNQKFNDFRKLFGQDVGLMTGDIKINVKASILIMTTEILHNMLCSSAETIRDLEIVIMDEVHYLNDSERGHVWEEILIMLPKHVTLVLLSATVPNTMEFADWLGMIRGGSEAIHVVMTHKRPVPLEHNIYLGISRSTRNLIFNVFDKDGNFNSAEYQNAAKVLRMRRDKFFKIMHKNKQEKENKGPKDPKDILKDAERQEKKPKSPKDYTGGKTDTPGTFMAFAKSKMSAEEIANHIAQGNSKLVGRENNFQQDKEIWLSLIEVLKEKQLMPTIVFFFDRNRLEASMKLLESIDLLDMAEKREVKHFLNCALHQRLKSNDRYLANVVKVCQMAERGLGIHHARMLPLMKEIVEMLFARGHIRILFSTETFAMGVNMPARCVVFSTLRKFDGRQKRLITSSEYTQMAGRAGRRGLDSVGKVLIIVNSPDSHYFRTDPPLTDSELKQVITGKATLLQSKFRITYSMILLLHRVEWITPQEVMRKSFREASGVQNEPKLLKNRLILEDRINSYSKPNQMGPFELFHAWIKNDIEIFQIASQQTVDRSFHILCPYDHMDGCQEKESDRKSLLSKCNSSILEYYMACLRYNIMRKTAINLIAKFPNYQIRKKLLQPGRLVIFEHESDQATSSHLNHLKVGMIVSFEKDYDQQNILLELLTFTAPDERLVTIFDESIISKSFKGSSSLQQATTLNRILDEEDLSEDRILQSSSKFPYPPQLLYREIPRDLDTIKVSLKLKLKIPLNQIHMITDTCLDAKEDLLKESFLNTLRSSVKNLEILSKVVGFSFKNILSGSKNQEVDKFLFKVSEEFLRIQSHLYNHEDLQINSIDFYGQFEHEINLVQRMLKRSLDCEFKPTRFNQNNTFDKILRRAMMIAKQFEPFELSLLSSMLLENPESCQLLSQCHLPRRHINRIHRHLQRLFALEEIKYQLSDDALSLHNQYKARLMLLQEWGFIDRASSIGCITTKGRVACEIQTSEILITQMLFDGFFTNHTPLELAALFSCFVCETRCSARGQKKKKDADTSIGDVSFVKDSSLIGVEQEIMPVVDGEEEKDSENLIEDLLNRCNIHEEKKLDVKNSLLEMLLRYSSGEGDASADTAPGKKFLSNYFDEAMNLVPVILRPTIQKMLVRSAEMRVLQDQLGVEAQESDSIMILDLVQATYLWANGSTFSSIIEMTPVPEGDVVRTLQRLDELLRHVHSSCYFLGDSVMAVALDESRELIRRGIVSIPSLYVSEEANEDS